MKVLVACEYSGIVRDAFLARGHDAMSCDILPTESPGPHYQGDVRDVLGDGWDVMIAHPPCTYLTSAAEWAYKDVQTKRIKRRGATLLCVYIWAFYRPWRVGRPTGTTEGSYMELKNQDRQQLAAQLYEEAIKHPGVFELMQVQSRLESVDLAVRSVSRQQPSNPAASATSAAQVRS